MAQALSGLILPAALGRYLLLRRHPAAEGERYVAADREAGLVDVHLLPAGEEREILAQGLCAVSHPNVAVVLDTGRAGAELYIVEEHIGGVSLAELAERAPLPGDVFLYTIAILASALGAAEQVAERTPALAVRVPRPGALFVSWAGHLRVSAADLLVEAGRADTLIEGDVPTAAGAPRKPGSLAELGALALRWVRSGEAQDAAGRAALELAASMAQGAAVPSAFQALSERALAALRRVVTAPGGEFLAAKLAELVERRAPQAAAAEEELAWNGAVALGEEHGGAPLPEVRAWRPPLAQLFYDVHRGGAAPTSARTPRPSLPPLSGQAVGGRLPGTPYQLLRPLGIGGMGMVYEAEHEHLGRRVAIKVLRGDLRKSPRMLARFRQEARSAARVQHPGVVSVFDFGATSAGELFLAMELVEGQTLTRVLAGGPPPLPVALEVLRQVCEAAEAAHRAGVVHRDLKPDNIMLLRPPPELAAGDGGGPEPPPRVKVLDFGIATMVDPDGRAGPGVTAPGQIVGTPEYIAPEQILGMKGDHRADIYALGCIAYELLTGELPFVAETARALLALHLRQPPPPLRERAPARGIPEALERVVLKAMAKERRDRYASMAELAAALEEAQRELAEGQGAAPLEAPRRSGDTPLPVAALQAAALADTLPAPRVEVAVPEALPEDGPMATARIVAPRRRRAAVIAALGLGATLIGTLLWGSWARPPDDGGAVTGPAPRRSAGAPAPSEARAAAAPAPPGGAAAIAAAAPAPPGGAAPGAPVVAAAAPAPPGGAAPGAPVVAAAPPDRAHPRAPIAAPAPSDRAAPLAEADPTATPRRRHRRGARPEAPAAAPAPQDGDGAASRPPLSLIVVSRGGYGARALARGLSSARPALDSCAGEGAEAWEANLSFLIGPEGIEAGSLQGGAALAPLLPCLERALRAARFSKPSAPARVTLALRRDARP